MSKSELACKLQGSAVGFVEVPETTGSRKQHYYLVRAMVKDSKMHALGCVFNIYPLK
jgi:hypothetical protein